MNRRDFAKGAVLGAATVIPAGATFSSQWFEGPTPLPAFRLLKTFKEPVTAMTVFRDKLYVAVGCEIFELDVSELK